MIIRLAFFDFIFLVFLFRVEATFTEETVKFGVAEDAPIGTVVGRLPPFNAFSSYRLSRGNSKISFDDQSLELKVSSPLDRESEDTIDMLVVTSPPSIIHILIDILDVNDNPPAFPSDTQRIEIFESAPIGWRIAISGATDSDAGANGTIAGYKLDGDSNDGIDMFRVIQQDGLVFLELTTKLDRELVDFYSFRLVATDGGNPPRSSFCTLNIVVLDTNDNTPDFGIRSIILESNGSSNTILFKLNATDPDSGANGEISYRLVGNSEVLMFLKIENGSDLVTKKNTVEYCSPQCEFTIVATDSGTPPLSANLDVVLRVVHGNLNEPNINIRFYPSDFEFIVVSPDDVNGKTLAILSISDPDGPVGKNSTIWLESGNEDNIFSLISRPPSINILTLKNSENAAKELYELEFLANDDQPPVDRIGKRVLKVFFKKFIQPVGVVVAGNGKQYAEIDSDAIRGSFVFHMATNCSNKCSFQLADVEKENLPFKIDSENGIIVTTSSLPDDVASYHLLVQIRLPPPSTELVTTEVLVNVRKSSSKTKSELQKMVHLKRAHQFSAFKDTPVGTVVGMLPRSSTYTVDGTNSSLTPVEVFPDGAIFVARPLTQDLLKLSVVLNTRNTTQRTEVTIVVKKSNLYAPECDSSTLFEIAENSESGKSFGTLKSFDKDGDVISYQLLDNHDLIYIEPSTGRILSKVVFDAEKLQNFTFHYKVQDYGFPSRFATNCSSTVTILDLNDNPPKFNNFLLPTTISISGDVENEYVANVDSAVSDEDVTLENRKVQYRIMTYTNLFGINSTSGEIRTKTPIPTTFSRINLTIEAVNVDVAATSFLLIHVKNQQNSRIQLSSNPVIRIHKKDKIGTEIGKVTLESDTIVKSWQFEGDDGSTMIDAQGNIILMKKEPIWNNLTLNIKTSTVEKNIPFTIEHADSERELEENEQVVEKIRIQKQQPLKYPIGPKWKIVRTIPSTAEAQLKIRNGTLVGEITDTNATTFVFLEAKSKRNAPATSFRVLNLFSVSEPDLNTLPNPSNYCRSTTLLITPPAYIFPNCSSPDTNSFHVLTNMSNDIDTSNASTILIKSQDSIVSTLDLATSNGSPFMITAIKDHLTENVKFASNNFLMLLSSAHPIGNSFGRVTAESAYRIRYYLVGTNEDQITIDADSGELFLKKRFYKNLNDVTIVAVIPTGIAKTKASIEVIEDRLHLPNSEFVLFAPPILKLGAPIGRIDSGRSDVVLDVIDSHFYIRKDVLHVKQIPPMISSSRFYEIQGLAKKGKLSAAINITIVFGAENGKMNKRSDAKENELVYSVEENSKIGSFVGSVPNPNGAKYRLIDPDNCGIMIDQDGIIRTTQVFDWEKTKFIKTKMIETAMNRIWEILVFIDDLNDNPPKLTSPTKTVLIPIQSASDMDSDFSFQLFWTDADSDAANNFRFEIVDGDFDGLLQIDDHGKITKSERTTNNGQSFNATFRIYDSAPPFVYHSDEVTILFDMVGKGLEQGPMCKNSTIWVYGTIPENGEVIGKVSSWLPSTFRILPSSLPNAEFVIDAMTGEIIVNKKTELGKVKDYLLEVQVVDYRGEQFSSCFVGVNMALDLEPSEVKNFAGKTFHVKETADRGTFIGSVTTSNITDLIIFRIEDFDANFTISPFDGRLFTNAPLDFEEIQKYSINISATVIGTNTSLVKTFEIQVEDENDEAPRFITGDVVHLSISEEENEAIQWPVIIGSSIAEDLDEGQNGQVTYSIVSGNTSLFAVNSTTGDILKLGPVDREDIEVHELIIEARDAGNPPNFATSKILITVLDANDNSPVFLQSSYFSKVSENSPAGQKLIQIKADDLDKDENSRIRYELEVPNTGSPIPFKIDEATGWITTITGPGVKLDREEQEDYSLTVIASDHGVPPKYSKCKVNIQVLDENDNWPIIRNENLDIFVPNNIAKGGLVHVVDAWDLDKADVLKFSINGNASSDDSKYFKIGEEGEIVCNELLTTKSYFQIVVVVSDGKHATSSSFTFYLQPVTDFPRWIETIGETEQDVLKVREHEGQQIAVFRAMSGARGDGKVRYTLVSKCREHVEIDGTSGILSTRPSLDREDFSHRCSIFVIATSFLENKPLSVISKAIIEIVDVNDNSPEFEHPLYSFNITENSGASRIGKVQASDKDEGQNSKIIYQILEGDPFHEFIVGEDGGIESIRDLDRESKKEYVLKVGASDSGEPKRSSNTTVRVTVLDEDDNAPRFSRIFHADVSENLPIGSFVIQLSASDADENSDHQFSFVDAVETLPFYVEQHSGKVFTNSTLDYEKKSSYRIKVRLTDGIWSIETSLFITVVDVNDNYPKFSASEYLFFKQNDSTMLVIATDEDSAENGRVWYSISNSHDFRIDVETGEISKIRHYTGSLFSQLRVVAQDRGVPPLRAESQVFMVEEIEKWKKDDRKIRKNAEIGSVIGIIEMKITKENVIVFPKGAAQVRKNGDIVLEKKDVEVLYVIFVESQKIIEYSFVKEDGSDKDEAESKLDPVVVSLPSNALIGVSFATISPPTPQCSNFEPISTSFSHPFQINQHGSVKLVGVPQNKSWKLIIACNDGYWPKDRNRQFEVLVKTENHNTDALLGKNPFKLPSSVRGTEKLEESDVLSRVLSNKNVSVIAGESEDGLIILEDSKYTVIQDERVMVKNGMVLLQRRIEEDAQIEIYRRKRFGKQFRRFLMNIAVDSNNNKIACPIFHDSVYFVQAVNSSQIYLDFGFNPVKVQNFHENCHLVVEEPFYFNTSKPILQLFSNERLSPGTYQTEIAIKQDDRRTSTAHLTISILPYQHPEDELFPQIVFLRENYKTSPHRPILQHLNALTDAFTYTHHLSDDNLRQVFDVTENGAISNRIGLNAEMRNVYRIPITAKKQKTDEKRKLTVRIIVDDEIEVHPAVLNSFADFYNLNYTVVRIGDSSGSLIEIDGSPRKLDSSRAFKCQNRDTSLPNCHFSLKMEDHKRQLKSSFFSPLSNSSIDYTIDINFEKYGVFEYDRMAQSAIDIQFYAKSSAIAQLVGELKRHYEDMKVVALAVMEMLPDAKYRLALSLIDRNGALLEPSETRRTVLSFIQRTRPVYMDFDYFVTNHCAESEPTCYTTIKLENNKFFTSRSSSNGDVVDLPRGEMVGVMRRNDKQRSNGLNQIKLRDEPKKEAQTCDDLICGKTGKCALSYFEDSSENENSGPYCQCGTTDVFESKYSCDDELLPFSINGGGSVQLSALNYTNIQQDAEQNCEGVEKLQVDFRTSGDDETTILIVDFGKQKAIVEISFGYIRFSLADEYTRPVQVRIEKPRVNDGHWHRLVITMSPDGKKLSVQVDGRGKEVTSRIPLPLLFSSEKIEIFSGSGVCFRRLITQNHYIHPNHDANKFFSIFTTTSISTSCPIDRRHRALSFFNHFSNSTTISLLIVLALITLIGLFVGFLVVRRKCFNSSNKDGKSAKQNNAGFSSSGWKRVSEIDGFAIRPSSEVNVKPSETDTYDVASLATYSNLEQVKQTTSTDDVTVYTTRASKRIPRYQQARGQINMAYL